MNAARAWRGQAAAAVLALWLAGCSTVLSPMSDAASHVPPAKPVQVDPWERFNRAVFSFNDSVDRAVLIPLARAYKKVVPEIVSQGFENVVNNVTDVWSAVNHLLQGKPQQALDTGMRVGINTVFGLGGILDVASEAGLERQTEDFGQTLGRWGFGPGPYLVLPFLGPSNVRDAAAWPLDRITSFPTLAGDGANVYTLTALELIHARAGLLNASSILGQVALDRYTFVRDSYLARRRSAVYDGNPPPEPEDDAQEQASEARLRK